ncbi:flagellin [Vibrio sp. 947]|uniref:flagellin N-terminal helical domain-containing protein n=1 Tax=Vibrio sp. 947 TaxID=3074619 RepID=UPI0029648348|nr:flagellin [Vibrio sp. 947]MDW1925027.1 flagellin [Vibrio sp. 947]
MMTSISSINTNAPAMQYQSQLNRSIDKQNTSMERLSSGLKINSAKDDAAGLQISNRLLSQSRGMDVAIRNANDGISMLQTAEGALGEYTENLMHMRDLTLRYANGSLDSADRSAVQQEFNALKDELNRIAETSSFGGQRLLNGENSRRSYQIGADSGESISVLLPNLSSLREKKRPEDVPEVVDFVEVKNDWVAKDGDHFIIRNSGNPDKPPLGVINLEAGSTLYDLADEINDRFGDEMGVFVDDEFKSYVNKYNNIQPSGVRLVYFTRDYIRYGSKPPAQNFYFPKYSGAGNDPLTHRIGGSANRTQEMMYYKELPSLESTDHRHVLEQIDVLLQHTDSERARLGATQNRLSHAINNLSQSSENVAASNRQIRDTDFAKETTELTKQSILREANTSILAQAGNAPRSALNLLS